MSGGFAEHLREAIAINVERRGVYAEMTGGRSRWLSNLLIASERLTLPMALFLDARAARFNREGVGVVAEDFVPMAGLPGAETPPRYDGCSPKEEIQRLRGELKEVARAAREGARGEEFGVVCEVCAECLEELEALQERLGAHFAMVVHLVESVGFGAANAPRWAEESDGESVRLSRTLVSLQAKSLVPGLRFDVMAQRLHGEGCGILVNDVPAIPFPR